jgi:hypothetical protein
LAQRPDRGGASYFGLDRAHHHAIVVLGDVANPTTEDPGIELLADRDGSDMSTESSAHQGAAFRRVPASRAPLLCSVAAVIAAYEAQHN